jgi:hypothetical protein
VQPPTPLRNRALLLFETGQIDPLIADAQERTLVAGIVAERRNLGDRYRF